MANVRSPGFSRNPGEEPLSGGKLSAPTGIPRSPWLAWGRCRSERIAAAANGEISQRGARMHGRIAPWLGVLVVGLCLMGAGDRSAGQSSTVATGEPAAGRDAQGERAGERPCRRAADSRTLYGANIEWIWNGNGMWQEQERGVHPEMARPTRDLGASVLRYPGEVLRLLSLAGRRWADQRALCAAQTGEGSQIPAELRHRRTAPVCRGHRGRGDVHRERGQRYGPGGRRLGPLREAQIAASSVLGSGQRVVHQGRGHRQGHDHWAGGVCQAVSPVCPSHAQGRRADSRRRDWRDKSWGTRSSWLYRLAEDGASGRRP